MECPYCRQCNLPDIKFIRNLEEVIVKTGMMGLTEWNCYNIRNLLKDINDIRWRLLSVYKFIEGYNEDEIMIMIITCLESLTSRGYFMKKGKNHYIYQS